MHPELFGMSAYFLMWVVATATAIATALLLTRRAGFPIGRSLLALLLFALLIVTGAKLMYMVETVFFPDPLLHQLGGTQFDSSLGHGFRLPGGLLLLAIVGPLVCSGLGLAPRSYLDAFVPSIGIAVVFLRTGCFLNGCCFGARSDSFLGVTFPAVSKLYEFQLLRRDIAWPAQATLPVLPLQLYFAAVGALMFGLGLYWQRTRRRPGEVWAKEYLLFFVSTFVLELLRGNPLPLNLVVTAATSLAAAAWIFRSRSVATTRAVVT